MSTPKTLETGQLPLAGATGSAVCELKLYSQTKIRGPNGKRIFQTCGKPAWYIWSPRDNPDAAMIVCKECGEAHAGNFKDELTPYDRTQQRRDNQ
jgi:hypothetical protein